MAKYRKKPVVIDAWQLNLTDKRSTIALYEKIHNVDLSTLYLAACTYTYDEIEKNKGLKIPTLEGNMIASDGDYIIKGVQGEFYPCKPDIFNATYEEVNSEPQGKEDFMKLSDCALAVERFLADTRSRDLGVEAYRRTLVNRLEWRGVEFGKSVVTIEGMRGEYFVPSMEVQLSRYDYVKEPMLALQKITEKGEVSNKLQYATSIGSDVTITIIGEYDFGKKSEVKYNE